MDFDDIKKEIEKWIPNPFESGWENLGPNINQYLRNELNLQNLPYIPIVSLTDNIDVAKRLTDGAKQGAPVREGLKTNTYTIRGHTSTGYEFLFGKTKNHVDFLDIASIIKEFAMLTTPATAEKEIKETVSNDNLTVPSSNLDPLTTLPLDQADQYALGLTTYDGIYERAKEKQIERYAKSLEDPLEANKSFWPNIAEKGIAYNLLILQKVGEEQKSTIQKINENIWTDEMEELSKNGLLYFIDMSIFRTLKVGTVKDKERFAPSTITILKQNSKTKELTPISIEVSGYEGRDSTVFTNSDNAWLYALQAAKCSITIFGIWLGHVYQWHLLPGTMFETLEKIPLTHPIQKLISPHSKYVRAFNNFMILKWDITPPTATTNPLSWLQLNNAFAENRNYHDDDPKIKLNKFGIKEENFSTSSEKEKKWDVFPIAQQSIEIWDAIEEYVQVFVDQHYKTDQLILDDEYLQEWIRESSDPNYGNIKGLSATNKTELASVLTSLIFRVITHGTARMLPASHPLAMFVGNFPPCLQKSDIPHPDKSLRTDELLEYMPVTGTISEVINFYYIFSFVIPYEPLIPYYGVESQPFFDKDDDKCNMALAKLRTVMINYIKKHSKESPPKFIQKYQWPMCVED